VSLLATILSESLELKTRKTQMDRLKKEMVNFNSLFIKACRNLFKKKAKE